MDINTLRGISVIFVFFAFMGVCWWAFSPKRRKQFDEAANLPFADTFDAASEQNIKQKDEQVTGEKSTSTEDKTSS